MDPICQINRMEEKNFNYELNKNFDASEISQTNHRDIKNHIKIHKQNIEYS